jgi:pimeloyl-ACP methyl ester carboxylesterase
MLRLAARRTLAAAVYSIPGALPLGVRLFSPLLARDWKTWYAMFEKDLSRTTLQSFHYSIASLWRTDLRARLREIHVPVIAIYGQRDRIVNPGQGRIIAERMPVAQVASFEESGHFPMLDEPQRFHQTLQSFLDR